MLISHLPKTQILNIIFFKTKCFMFNLCFISKSRFLHILDCRGDKGYRQTLPQSKVKVGTTNLVDRGLDIHSWGFTYLYSKIKHTCRSPCPNCIYFSNKGMVRPSTCNKIFAHHCLAPSGYSVMSELVNVTHVKLALYSKNESKLLSELSLLQGWCGCTPPLKQGKLW